MSEGETLESELSENCREAVSELQEERPEAEVIAVKGDWAWVSIGDVRPAHINGVFDQETAHAVIRIPTDFPNGRRPYGIVTYPYVTKHDGQDADSEHRDHKKGRPAREALGVDEVGLWSYRWQNISWNDPKDLRKAPEIVRSRFEKED
ncbi:hypothetical protein JMJ58_05365 [Haloterrigena salifodinae]|uniref:Uncharacterized protein n=1 Tax=Haloterrigena salifodinae TaxID=2675099 RepID=A0A8T8E4A5_9EURY|nr:hypothetical protein [Haloterrigena salifodinae]QRV16322.1 hypothetical protein JMJ58_05365 [Haloterrigena salifodinae]